MSAPQFTIGLQRERVRIVHEVPAYYWRCELCGWLGTGLLAAEYAMREAGNHAEKTHGLKDAAVSRVDWATPDIQQEVEMRDRL